MTPLNSYSLTQNSLLEAISDDDRKVIVLSGDWGVGKTYLWNEVRNKSTDKKIKDSIYVTGFGTNDINDLKLRILQNIYLVGDTGKIEKLRTALEYANSFLNKIVGKSAEDLLLLLLPKALENKLVVIDDVERRACGLSLEQFMGFLNEYSEAYRTQFLIILNTNKLKQKEAWEELHEKTIDIEINLNPSPYECFYKVKLEPLVDSDERLLKVLAVLDLRNIRVIKKIRKNISFLKNKFNIDEIPPVRWVPSIALLTAMAYKAIENAPTFDYILSYNSYSNLLKQQKDKDPVERRWDSILESLEINHADDFEIIFHGFLKTGIFDEKRLKDLLCQYKSEESNKEAHDKIRDFFKSVYWDSQLTKEDLQEIARELLFTAKYMDPQTVSNMAQVVAGLGDNSLAMKYLDDWEASLIHRNAYQNLEERVVDNSFGKLHDRVFNKLKQLRDSQHPPIDIFEAANNILRNSGWGEKEKIAFKDSTKDKYVEVICRLEKDSLYKFFKLHFDWFRNNSYDDDFSVGKMNFIQACVEILETKPHDRISEIILTQYAAAGFSEKLQP